MASAHVRHELQKAKGTSKSMVLVPLFDLKFLKVLAAWCRNFKSAALARLASMARPLRPDQTRPGDIPHMVLGRFGASSLAGGAVNFPSAPRFQAGRSPL